VPSHHNPSSAAFTTDIAESNFRYRQGTAYERPENVSDEDIEIYLRPHVRSEQRTRDLQRFVAAFDNKHTVQIEHQLRQLEAPTLIVWGTDDVYFPVKWAHWLAKTIPGAKLPIELHGARLFFIEERAEVFNRLLRDHMVTAQKEVEPKTFFV
jgi:pimeloyl-ACP methyl ester carboxylesterase